MNQTKFQIIVIIIISIATFNSCKKDKMIEEDYRKKYIGNFYFVNDLRTYTSDTTYNDSTIYYHGTIAYGSDTNQIYIRNTPNGGGSSILFRNGFIGKIPNSGNGYSFHGQFNGYDSLVTEWKYFGGYGATSITYGKRE